MHRAAQATIGPFAPPGRSAANAAENTTPANELQFFFLFRLMLLQKAYKILNRGLRMDKTGGGD
jgi:hypothetical protein